MPLADLENSPPLSTPANPSTPHATPRSLTRPPPYSRWAVPAAIAIFLSAMAFASTGFIEHYDEVVHYLYAQRAFSDSQTLINIWARIGCTAYFGLFAPFGIEVTRFGGVLATLSVGLGATIVLKHFLRRLHAEKHPFNTSDSLVARHAVAALWLLMIAQPFFTLFSFTVMTEILLASTWIWAAAALTLQHNRPWRGVVSAGFILGLGGLMRPEGWIAVACWPAFAALWLARPVVDSRYSRLTRGQLALPVLLSTFLAGLPTLAWYLAGLIVVQKLTWFVDFWPWPAASQFGKTSGLFLLSLFASQALWLWIPILFALQRFWRDTRSTSNSPKPQWRWQTDALLLLGGPVLGMYLMHGILGNFGLFGSLSLPRYFICISPMSAILAVFGLIYLEKRPNPFLATAVRLATFTLPLALLAFLIWSNYLPTAKNLATRRLDIVCEGIRQRAKPEEFNSRVIAGHPYILYVLNMKLDGPGDLRTLTLRHLAEAPPGTLLAVDNYLWETSDRPSAVTLRSWGYRMDETIALQVDKADAQQRPILIEAEVSPARLWIKER